MYIHYCIKVSLVAHCLQYRRPGFNPWVLKIRWRGKWQPTPVSLPGETPWTQGSQRVGQAEQLSAARHRKQENKDPSSARGGARRLVLACHGNESKIRTLLKNHSFF